MFSHPTIPPVNFISVPAIVKDVKEIEGKPIYVINSTGAPLYYAEGIYRCPNHLCSISINGSISPYRNAGEILNLATKEFTVSAPSYYYDIYNANDAAFPILIGFSNISSQAAFIDGLQTNNGLTIVYNAIPNSFGYEVAMNSCYTLDDKETYVDIYINCIISQNT